MADKKISELTANPSITGAEQLPLSKSGSNYRNTFAELRTYIAPQVLIVPSGDFAGNDYTNAALSGKTPDSGFLVYSDNGSGLLLKVTVDYTFSGSTITLDAGADNIRIIIL